MTWKSIIFLYNDMFQQENLLINFLPKKFTRWHFAGKKIYTRSVHLICIHDFGTDKNQ